MVPVLFTISGVLMIAFAFSCTIFFFNKLLNHGEKERKRRDLAFEKLQRARDEWNKHKMKQLDFIIERLHQEN